MPGKKLTVEDGEVREADGGPRKFYVCPSCDAIRGTAGGIETHIETEHTEARQ